MAKCPFRRPYPLSFFVLVRIHRTCRKENELRTKIKRKKLQLQLNFKDKQDPIREPFELGLSQSLRHRQSGAPDAATGVLSETVTTCLTASAAAVSKGVACPEGRPNTNRRTAAATASAASAKGRVEAEGSTSAETKPSG